MQKDMTAEQPPATQSMLRLNEEGTSAAEGGTGGVTIESPNAPEEEGKPQQPSEEVTKEFAVKMVVQVSTEVAEEMPVEDQDDEEFEDEKEVDEQNTTAAETEMTKEMAGELIAGDSMAGESLAAASSSWTCTRCTLINEGKCSSCEVCEAVRPTAEAVDQIEDDDEEVQEGVHNDKEGQEFADDEEQREDEHRFDGGAMSAGEVTVLARVEPPIPVSNAQAKNVKIIKLNSEQKKRFDDYQRMGFDRELALEAADMNLDAEEVIFYCTGTDEFKRDKRKAHHEWLELNRKAQLSSRKRTR